MILNEYTMDDGHAAYDMHTDIPALYAKLAKKVANIVGRYVRDKLEDNDIVAIAYTGQSGCVLAHYVLLHADTGSVAIEPTRIRKDGEVSHFEPQSIDDGIEKAIIVDDFIESGETCEWMIDTLADMDIETTAIALIGLHYGRDWSTDKERTESLYENYDMIGLK